MEHEFEKQKMDSVRALAETNMEISKARGILVRLQEEETSYLDKRERAALDRIDKAVASSRILLAEINQNHEQVKSFNQTISQASGFLTEMHEKFFSMLQDFNKRSEMWEESVKERENQIAELRRDVTIERDRLENTKKIIERKEEQIRTEKEIIESRQLQIKKAMEVLKKKQ